MNPSNQLALLLLLGGSVASGTAWPDRAASGGESAATAPGLITVDANDYALNLPDRVPAGIVTFRLVNRGKEPHHLQVVRLERGKTAGDFIRAFSDTAPMPAWVRYLGGPTGAPPGQERSSTTRLTPGHYAALCRILSPDGTTHVMKGMIREFEVVAARGAGVAAFPVATDTMTLNDYGFVSARPLARGHHTVRVGNAGRQPHEMVLIRLVPGKTPADFARWGLSGRRGPPPGGPVGGVEFLDRGANAVFTVDLSPGDYGYICFVPDDRDGKRHYVHGMMTQFAVR